MRYEVFCGVFPSLVRQSYLGRVGRFGGKETLRSLYGEVDPCWVGSDERSLSFEHVRAL